jgi:poly-gamma-glutamate capsule biosynthesis protein CapA/YwtB (metallophosphatase superfamily)
MGLGISVLAVIGGIAFLRSGLNLTGSGSCKDGALSVVAVGDIMMGSDIATAERVTDETRSLLKSGNVTLASMVMTLLTDPGKAEPRGPRGGSQHAQIFKGWGFSAFARANDYANAFGHDGMEQTDKILQDNKLVSAGLGADLNAARAPAWVDTPCGKVAIVSVGMTLRDLDPNPALPERAGIAGRWGINPLHITAVTHADAETYAKLLASNAGVGGTPPDANGTLHAFGITIVPGKTNVTTTIVSAKDKAEVLGAISEVRKTAALVILSLGSYESNDKSQEPLPFVEDFAREAIEAGAGLVVGHGSRSVRAVEFHKGGLITYGLGDFVSDKRIGVHLGANAADPSRPDVEGAAPVGAILSASFRNGHVASAHLTGLSLEATADLPPGFPRLSQTPTVLNAIERPSAARGAKLTIQNGSAEITPIEPSK